MYTGTIPLPGRSSTETDDAYLARVRQAAVYPLGPKRGTHEAIRRTVMPLLTGTQSVFIADDYGGDYDVLIRTITSETPDPAAVATAITGGYVSGGPRGAIRAELIVTYLTADSVTFAEATRRLNAVAAGVTTTNVTRGDVT
jgi:hypothetical protein